MLRMAALIQQRRLGLLAGMNRHQYRSLRMMFAKVIAKSTLPNMKCLHTTLLYPVLIGASAKELRCLSPSHYFRVH